MYRKLLAVAICSALAVPAFAHGTHKLDLSLADATPGTVTVPQATTSQTTNQNQNQTAQTAPPPPPPPPPPSSKKATKLKKIIVTGSLIPRSQIETATQVIQITSQEMQREGFATVADALQALPQATGSVQGSQFSGGFTQGAKTIRLLGLPPGFTLFLINGKPMADYPLLYNGSGAFTDISSIPMAMVDHIDIVPGNQSSIYGSSAIAGVVNIILKKHVHGLTLDLRFGGFTQGGGGSQRLELTGGHQWSKASLTYSLQLIHDQPIYRYQNSWVDSLDDNPALQPGEHDRALNYLLLDAFHSSGSHWFFVPGGKKSWCQRVSKAFNNTVRYFTDPAGRGHACGSPIAPAYSTMKNGIKSAAGYVHFTYDVTPTAEFYITGLYNFRKQDYFVGSTYTWWGSYSDLGFVYAPNVDNGFAGDGPGTFLRTQYVIDTSPAGIGHASDQKNLNRAYNVTTGFKGSFGNSDWTYDAYYHRSDNVVLARQEHLVASKVDHYFLGDRLPGLDPILHAYPRYDLNLDRFYSIMSAATYRSLSAQIRTRSHTYSQEINGLVTNTNLFNLPGGSAGFAAELQFGNQLWDNPTDPRLIQGYFWGRTGTIGHGKRHRWAAAAEMTFPVASWLTIDTSARYDSYMFAGRTDAKATYKVGLEWRPTENLLVRGTYSTAFRAPSMPHLFQGKSGFYTHVVDSYLCRLALGDHYDVNQCPFNNVQITGTTRGSLELKDITAKSITGGIVWSPTSNFNIDLNYYRIKVDNEVSDRGTQNLVNLEASCLIGHNIGGATIDPNSPSCQQVFNLVTRTVNPLTGLDEVSNVDTYPINISWEFVQGVSAGAHYRWNTGTAGIFVFSANYQDTLDHHQQVYPGDPVHDLLSLPYLFEFKSRASGEISWNKGRWGATVYGIRDGTMVNYQVTGRLPPWMIYNVSLSFQANDNVKISLISKNVLNNRPPIDVTHTAYPYYNEFAYNAFGREIFAELNWKFF